MNINQAYEKWITDNDEEALGALHSQLLNMAQSIVVKMASDVTDPTLSYDLATDVIMNARNAHPIPAAFSVWAYRHMLHDVLDCIDRQNASKRSAVTLPLEEVEIVDTESHADDAEFNKRLDALSVRDRRIATLLIEGYTPRAVAKELGVDHKIIDRRLPAIAYQLWGDIDGITSGDA